MKKEDPEIKQAPLPKSRADLEYQITMLLNRDDISEGELPIPGRANKRILLLQNDKLAVKKLEKELNAAFQDEFKTESVYSIEQAIERIAHKRFDLLAVDKDMPGYKGLDVIDRLREANIETPIVILTGRQDKELAIKALNQGVDDYIVAGPDIAMIGRALLFSLERTRADRLQRASLKLDKLAIRDVLEHAPIMMIRIDEQYLIRDCNTSFATTTGRLIKDLKGRSIFEVVPGFQTAGIKEVLETGNTLQKRVRLTGLADRDDLDMTWNLVCWPVFRSLAGTKEALITGVDISHEAQLETERDEFIASLAHDVRNPLYGQVQILRAMLQKETISENAFKNLELLKVSSSNLLLLLDDLLTTYALGEQKEHDRQEPLDVKAILLEQLEEVKYLASLSGKQIKLETDEYLPEITINRANFLRIITNLIHNAIKFGKRDTVIEVVLKTENNLLKCLISNVTEGLDELSDKSVFTRFARATKDAQHPHSSGLGLYLTRKIVESMGGSIEAEIEGSERIRFSVTIPLL